MSSKGKIRPIEADQIMGREEAEAFIQGHDKRHFKGINAIPILFDYHCGVDKINRRLNAERWRNKMMTVILMAALLAVLYGLIVSTEKVLQQRQERVVIDERMTEHRSRL